MLGIELVDGVIKILLVKIGADLAINETALDFFPVLAVVNPILEPIGVIAELVLLVALAGDGVAGAFVGDDEGEDSEGEEDDDEKEHDEEVEPEEPGDAAAGADEAGEGDDHQENAEDDHRLLQKLLADAVALPAQPDSGAEDRNRQQERYEVQDSDQVVAQSHHFLRIFSREI